ncbi:hypothetical protein KIPB_014971, partial [Kipferlia bialata]
LHIPMGAMISMMRRCPEMMSSDMYELDKCHNATVDDNHWYVYFLMVSEAMRGQGVGSILMDKAKALCDLPEHMSDLYLE